MCRHKASALTIKTGLAWESLSWIKNPGDMWLQNSFNTRCSRALIVCRSSTDRGTYSLEDEGGRVVQGMSSFLLRFMKDSVSLLSSQQSRTGLYTLKSTSSPFHTEALLSPAYLSPLTPPGKQRTGLEVTAPAAEIFEEGCSFRDGDMWRRRWLPRQGKRDVETDGCVHREHCLCGEQHVGGCTTQSCSFSNSPGWITPVGTYTMITIFIPVMIMSVWGGHTTTDLPTCCISSFYPLVLIWDFSGCSTPF